MNSNNYDLFIYLAAWLIPTAFCYLLAYKSSQGTSWLKTPTWYRGGFKWVPSNEKVPMKKTGWFAFAVMASGFGLIMFFVIGYDRFDLWFPSLYK